MPRIPDSELERLKKEISLLRLIESQGHTLQKRGKDWAMRCIFHEDATASLVVTEAKNLYHCFGCNAAGSVLDWVMKTQGVSLPHAVADVTLKPGSRVSMVVTKTDYDLIMAGDTSKFGGWATYDNVTSQA